MNSKNVQTYSKTHDIKTHVHSVPLIGEKPKGNNNNNAWQNILILICMLLPRHIHVDGSVQQQAQQQEQQQLIADVASGHNSSAARKILGLTRGRKK